jgi:tetratricopeptide (TPR) repeat protein
MARRKDKVRPSPALGAARPRAGRGRLWLFRLTASVLLPLSLLLLIELALRLAGFGYATTFLLPQEHGGKKVFVQNDRFGWRFFGREQSPQPTTFAFPRQKPADTIRIFVFGESAAFGDPQPDFGLPRMLHALLSQRFPGTRFEVINTAMVGINSHTILPIARDCARAGGDIWVLYMGNNEVVGPFGAGTVFGRQAATRAFIQSSLAFQTTRTGQMFDQLARSLRPPSPGKGEWGGMLMFLENRVRANDPRLPVVYQNFEQNLDDIITTGLRAGAGVVVSTVAVNLDDCAPFASAHRPDLSKNDEAEWRRLYERGIEAQRTGRFTDALDNYQAAAKIDDSFAELQFRLSVTTSALGLRKEADDGFARARDHDMLRFRCDSELNNITRRVVTTHRKDDRVRLVDAAEILEKSDFNGSVGRKFFYEHVHLTFEGNYQLARQLVDSIEALLPSKIRQSATTNWATAAECAARLAWTEASRIEAASDILGRRRDPPFIWQLDHAEQNRRLQEQIEQLRPGAQAEARRGGEIYRTALAHAPDDPVLHAHHAAWQAEAGDLKGATASARHVVELLPHSVSAWAELGSALGRQKEFAAAADAYTEGLRRDPDNYWARHNLAGLYLRLNRRADAVREYQRVLQIKPRFGPAHLGLGELLEAAGNKAEAEKHFQLALTHRVRRAEELASLARFCHDRGWYQAAVTNYQDAISLNPVAAPLHLGTGQCLAALGRSAEAGRYFAEAVRLAPDSGESRFLLGVDLGRQGQSAEAAEQFREAVRLLPELIEARLNLGVALSNLGKNAEALAQFEEVLRRNPTNVTAQQQIQILRQRMTAPALR